MTEVENMKQKPILQLYVQLYVQLHVQLYVQLVTVVREVRDNYKCKSAAITEERPETKLRAFRCLLQPNVSIAN